MALFDRFTAICYQDVDHTGHLHPSIDGAEKHFGLFLFDLGITHPEYIYFDLQLTVSSFTSTLAENVTLGKIVAGSFAIDALIPYSAFLVESDFQTCGFTPITIQDSQGAPLIIEKSIKGSALSSGVLKLSFIFRYTERYLGFRFVPAEFSSSETSGTYSLKFMDATASQSKRPALFAQNISYNIYSKDTSVSHDCTGYLNPEFESFSKDFSSGYDKFHSDVYFGTNDAGTLIDRSTHPRIHGTDFAHNYSMSIQHIALIDQGRSIEVYGYNSDTSRTYYEKMVRGFDFAYLKKFNFITWSGILVEWPWCSLLWYGDIFYFADQNEFADCCRLYFKDHGMDECPVCGESLGGHFKFCFIDVTRKPHQINFCSEECQRYFNGRMPLYLKKLTVPCSYYTGVTALSRNKTHYD